VQSGVPQGSVIGPLLFIIYTSELPSLISINGVKCSVFADDIKIFAPISNSNSIQQSLDIIADWGRKWQLPLAPNKCIALHIGQQNTRQSYFIEGNQIESQNDVRDLGFHIDSELKYSKHCKIIANNAKASCHSLLRALRTKNISLLVKAFTTYIRPKMEYGTTVFSPYLTKDKKILEKVQNYFTRRIFARCFNKTYENMLPNIERNEILKIETLEARRLINDRKMFQNLVFGRKRISQGTDHHYKIRSSNRRGVGFTIQIPKCKQNYRRHSFFIRTAIDFNLYKTLALQRTSNESA
jgi:ribonucleases P/MRP protein subunit RPP40